MVTTTMGMLNWIHSNTTDLRPAVPLYSEFVVCISSLQERFLCPASACNLTNHSSATTWYNLLGPRWKLDSGSAIVGVMADNNGVVTGGPGEDTAVTDVMLDVADDGTLGDGAEGEDVADDEIGLLATVDELAGVHTLSGDEELLLELVAERVAEGDLGERSAAAGVVDDVGDDPLDVAVALAEVEGAEPRRTLAVVGVGLEHRPRTLTLGADDTTHLLGRGEGG